MPEISWFLSKRISVPSFVLYVHVPKLPVLLFYMEKIRVFLDYLKYLNIYIIIKVFNRKFYLGRELDTNLVIDNSHSVTSSPLLHDVNQPGS